jgi:hypothetical protein
MEFDFDVAGFAVHFRYSRLYHSTLRPFFYSLRSGNFQMIGFLRFIFQIESRVFWLSVAYCFAQFVSALTIYIAGASIVDQGLAIALVPHIAELARLGGGQADLGVASSIYTVNLCLMVAYVAACVLIVGPIKYGKLFISYPIFLLLLLIGFGLSFDLGFGIQNLEHPSRRGNSIFTDAQIPDYFLYATVMPLMNAAFMVFSAFAAEENSRPWVYKANFPLVDSEKRKLSIER